MGALPYVPENTVIIGSASDGWDNSETAGAIADRELFEKVLDTGLDYEKYLNENDSFNFFKQSGGHIRTGRTGSNVADFYMILKGENQMNSSEEFYNESKNEEVSQEEELDLSA